MKRDWNDWKLMPFEKAEGKTCGRGTPVDTCPVVAPRRNPAISSRGVPTDEVL